MVCVLRLTWNNYEEEYKYKKNKDKIRQQEIQRLFSDFEFKRLNME